MKKIAATFLCALSLSNVALAEKHAPLINGMSFNEVIRIKGAPTSKDFHEAHHEVYWRYPDETLRFVDGKLASHVLVLRQTSPSITEEAPIAAPQTDPNHPITQKTVDEIIDAIPNDNGAGDASKDAKDSPSQQPVGIQTPQIISEE